MSRRVVLSAALAGVLVAGAAGGTVTWRQHTEQASLDRGARAAAETFARAWSQRALDQARYAGASPQQVAQSFAASTAALGRARATVSVTSVRRDGDTGTAELAVTWALPPALTWSYADPIRLVRQGEQWAVAASGHSMWHPELAQGGAFALKRDPGTRGEVLDRHGRALMANTTVHDIAIDPVNADVASVTALERLVGVPKGSLVARLEEATKSGARGPIPVITYRESDFAPVQGRLASLQGVIAAPRVQPLAPTRTFGQPLLGTVGPVTAEMVTKDPNRYHAGNYAGTSGLQRQYDAHLAPTPGVTVSVGGQSGAVLFEQPAQDGQPLALTLDPRAQQAAEKALTTTGAVPSALVAVDVASGDVLAVANSPAYGIDRALTGRYAPGSTLKVATTYALLGNGLSPAQQVPCPRTASVNGLQIRNFEGESLGPVPFSADFAHSCNTAFAGLSRDLADDDLHTAATALGIGGDWGEHLGVTGAYSGSVPVANGATDKAASAFGQGRTLASPVSLAVMTGSVARGSFVEPALVLKPAVSGAHRAPRPLDAAIVKDLHALMRAVVTDGTAPVLKAVPGGPVFAKTGTAEHDSSGTHPTCWLVGWQGDVAFAVLVEDGKSGGDTAAPVAKAFLAALHR